jgi:hypothetical protein
VTKVPRLSAISITCIMRRFEEPADIREKYIFLSARIAGCRLVM